MYTQFGNPNINILTSAPAQTAIALVQTSSGVVQVLGPTKYGDDDPVAVEQSIRLVELSDALALKKIVGFAADTGVRRIVVHKSRSLELMGISSVKLFGEKGAREYFGVGEILDSDPLVMYNPDRMSQESDVGVMQSFEHELWHEVIFREYPYHEIFWQRLNMFFYLSHWHVNFVNPFGHVFLRSLAFYRGSESWVYDDIEHRKQYIERKVSEGINAKVFNVILSIYMGWLCDTVMPYEVVGDKEHEVRNKNWVNQQLSLMCPKKNAKIRAAAEQYSERLLSLIKDSGGNLNMFAEIECLRDLFIEMRQARR